MRHLCFRYVCVVLILFSGVMISFFSIFNHRPCLNFFSYLHLIWCMNFLVFILDNRLLNQLLLNTIILSFLVVHDYFVLRMMRMILRVFWVNWSMVRRTCHWITKFVFFWLWNLKHFFRIVTVRNLEFVIRLMSFISYTFRPWFNQAIFSLVYNGWLLWWCGVLTLL